MKENGIIVHRKLEDDEKKKICKAIVFWLIDKQIILTTTRRDYIDIFEAIQMLFNKETMASYYIPPDSYGAYDNKTNKRIKRYVTARGKLYTIFKYNNDKSRNEKKKKQI